MARPSDEDEFRGQDQVIHLLYAFKLIKKFIPPNLTYNINGVPQTFINSNNAEIYDEMKILTHDIIAAMRTYDPDGWSWDIRNPATMQDVPKHRGRSALLLSYAFNLAYKEIWGWDLTVNGVWPKKKRMDCKATWKTFYQHWIYDQDFKIELMDGLTNSWPKGTTNQSPNVNSWELDNRCYYFDNWWIPDLHRVLFEPSRSPRIENYNTMETFCGNCNCEGVWNHGGGYHSTFPCAISSMIFHSENLGVLDNNTLGDYNGLDYMLIHNLRYLAFYDKMPPFTNKSDNVYISRDLQLTNPSPGDWGSHSNPYTLLSFNSINAVNKITPNSNVTYRASDEVNLLDGFEAQAPTEFYAYIDEVQCNSGEILREQNMINNNVESIHQKNPSIERKLKVYPNPTDDILNIHLQDPNGDNINGEISLYDQTGKLIRTTRLNYSTGAMSIADLVNGVYFLKIGRFVEKIIKK